MKVTLGYTELSILMPYCKDNQLKPHHVVSELIKLLADEQTAISIQENLNATESKHG
jgi:hypothetical protein